MYTSEAELGAPFLNTLHPKEEVPVCAGSGTTRDYGLRNRSKQLLS
jgi:hypothetical protein